MKRHTAAYWQAIEALLPGVICSRCGATLQDYADKCNADLAEVCPGFLAVEGAYQHVDKTIKTAGTTQ